MMKNIKIIVNDLNFFKMSLNCYFLMRGFLIYRRKILRKLNLAFKTNIFQKEFLHLQNKVNSLHRFTLTSEYNWRKNKYPRIVVLLQRKYKLTSGLASESVMRKYPLEWLRIINEQIIQYWKFIFSSMSLTIYIYSTTGADL